MSDIKMDKTLESMSKSTGCLGGTRTDTPKVDGMPKETLSGTQKEGSMGSKNMNTNGKRKC